MNLLVRNELGQVTNVMSRNFVKRLGPTSTEEELKEEINYFKDELSYRNKRKLPMFPEQGTAIEFLKYWLQGKLNEKQGSSSDLSKGIDGDPDLAGVSDDEIGMHDIIDAHRDSTKSPAHSSPEGLSTTGVKYDDNKVAFHLLPPIALEGTAWVFKYGGVKYDSWNHSKGMPWSKQYRAALGHLFEIGMSNPDDDESGIGHVYHAICSLMMLAENMVMHPDQNDLYPEEYKTKSALIKAHREKTKAAALKIIDEFKNKKSNGY